MKTVKIKFLNETAKLPQKATPLSAGYDLCSCQDQILPAHQYTLIPTGISIELPEDMEAQVRPRSGLAVKEGITVLNSPGTIDADYRGEIKVALINHSDRDFMIKKGMRIAQLIFSQIIPITLESSEELNTTARNQGGFGSTGME